MSQPYKTNMFKRDNFKINPTHNTDNKVNKLVTVFAFHYCIPGQPSNT